MEILETSLGTVPVLQVTGEIDHDTSSVFAEAATEVLRPDKPQLLLDLSDCVYFDSGGLAVILSIVRDFRTRGWLGVIGANANILRLFEIIGLTTEPCLRLFPSLEDASSVLARGAC
jgi:anti-anti-sigma factor